MDPSTAIASVLLIAIGVLIWWLMRAGEMKADYLRSHVALFVLNSGRDLNRFEVWVAIESTRRHPPPKEPWDRVGKWTIPSAPITVDEVIEEAIARAMTRPPQREKEGQETGGKKAVGASQPDSGVAGPDEAQEHSTNRLAALHSLSTNEQQWVSRLPPSWVFARTALSVAAILALSRTIPGFNQWVGEVFGSTAGFADELWTGGLAILSGLYAQGGLRQTSPPVEPARAGKVSEESQPIG